MPDAIDHTRRALLLGGLAGVAVAACPRIALAGTPNPYPGTVWLKRNGELHRIHYVDSHGRIDQNAMSHIAWVLRDTHANVAATPSIGTIDLLCGMQGWLAQYGRYAPFNVHSGCRLRSTNNHTEGAAKNSLHIPDQNNIFHATDIDSESVGHEYLGRLAAIFNVGGVGFYQQADFVHVDDGRRRFWRR